MTLTVAFELGLVVMVHGWVGWRRRGSVQRRMSVHMRACATDFQGIGTRAYLEVVVAQNTAHRQCDVQPPEGWGGRESGG